MTIAGTNALPRRIKKATAIKWLLVSSSGVFFLLLSLALLILGGYYLNVRYSNLPPQPDLGHMLIPYQDLRFLDAIGLITSVILICVTSFSSLSLKVVARLPYAFFMYSLWVLGRTIAMVATPLGVPKEYIPDAIPIKDVHSLFDLIQSGFASRNVLFFSGHVGLAFFSFLFFGGWQLLLRKPNPVVRVKIRLLAIPLIFITYTSLKYIGVAPYMPFFFFCIAIAWLIIVTCHRREVAVKNIFVLWSLVMAYTVLANRGHYLIDVFGGYGMSAFLFIVGKWMLSKIENFCDNISNEISA